MTIYEWSVLGKLEETVVQFEKVIEIDLNFALAIEWLQKAIVLDTSWIGALRQTAILIISVGVQNSSS